MTKHTQLFAALFLAACATPALAQDPPQAQDVPEKIVLEQKAGSVMTSTGGDYETTRLGELLVVNESMMLGDGAKATVVYYYDDGDRKCTEYYEGPNTFLIDDSCKKAAAYWTNNGSAAGSAAIITGAAIIGAVILESMDDVPGPLSLGPNGELRVL